MGSVELIKDGVIGEYYALRGDGAKNAFKNPMASCRKVILNSNDIVVDIGAFVGEYSMIASRVAKKVISYEASPDVFKVLSMNKKPNMTIHNKAVIGGNEKSIELFLSKGIGATNSIVKSTSKRGSVVVPAINYIQAVKGATVVKIDVEGAEYEYDIIQPYLRAIILEFHPIANIDWQKKANKVMSDLKKAGFKPLMIPGFKNGWDTNSAWVKK